MPRRSSNVPSLPEEFVDNPEKLKACLTHLDGVAVLAFDTEFVGEDAYRPELCLVQIATVDSLYVVDPFACGPLDRFWKILANPSKTVVVHAGREDIRLCSFAIGNPPANVFDIQIAAGLVGFAYPIGYAGIVQDLLGRRMSKGETLTDWRRRPLLPAQVRYAYDDVRFLLPAWRRLSDRLRRYDRVAWAEEEFVSFVRKAVSDEVAAEKWRKVKGIGGLDRRGLGIARELFGWREAFAKRVNRPARMLLRDDLLAEIARRPPKGVDDLQSIRGVPRSEIEAIDAAVSRAAALPFDQLPEVEQRDNDPPHIVLVANLLGVVLADLCARKKLAPSLVSSGQDLKALARAKATEQPIPDIPLTRGWRARAILPELGAVLDGRHSIRVMRPSSAAPLAYEGMSLSDEFTCEADVGNDLVEKVSDEEPIEPNTL